MKILKESILEEIKHNKFLNKKIALYAILLMALGLAMPNVVNILKMFGASVPNYIAYALAAAGNAGTVAIVLLKILDFTLPGWALWAIASATSLAL